MKLKLLLVLAFVLPVACGGTQEPQSQSPAATATTTPAQASTPVATTERSAPAQRIEIAQAEPAAVALADSKFENGTHYQRLSPTQPTSSGPDQVEVAEFFMYSCIHCYNFEPYLEQWLPEKASYVNFIHVPTVWNPMVRMHAQAFYAAEALGVGEEMHAPFFREIHVAGNYLDTEAAMAEFFGRFGVSESDFKSAFDSFAVHAKLQRADELARRYRVSSTPTIVVNGKYVANASTAGSYEALLELIDELAASER